MSIHTAKPSPGLAPYIKQYWAISNVLRGGESHEQRIVPSGMLELSFYLGDRPQSRDPNRPLSEATVVSGQQNSSYDLTVAGRLDMFSVTFQAQGAMMFFNLPLVELFDQTIPLKYLDKDWVDQVETDLFFAPSFAQRVGIIETALKKLQIQNHREFDAARIRSSVHLINHTQGVVGIDQLASRACLSRKQFERVFKACVGISPKRFLRVVRFQHVLFKKQHDQSSRLTELAYACGYYDQSHMINEFKALSGMSPREYFSECEPQSDYFVSL